MLSQITATAKTGPAKQTTAKVFTKVTKLVLDIERKTIEFDCEQGHKEFELAGVTTLTDSITADVHTIVIS